MCTSFKINGTKKMNDIQKEKLASRWTLRKRANKIINLHKHEVQLRIEDRESNNYIEDLPNENIDTISTCSQIISTSISDTKFSDTESEIMTNLGMKNYGIGRLKAT